MNIAQVRAQYPQYSDLSDKQLADALHAKFYSDLPLNDFYSKIGLQQGATERTWGEAASDIGASLASGAGAALQFPGQLVGLVPGLRGVGEAMQAPGEALQSWGEGLKSQGLKAREALRNQKLSEAEKDGVLAEFATAIKSTISDPALLASFVTEQLPQLIGPGGAAKVTTMLGKGAVEAAGKGLAAEAAKEATGKAAAALGKKAASAAVGTGATMQGADIGDETYKRVYAAAKAQGMSDEDAKSVAASKARVAALEAGAISIAAQRLPGGRAIEERLAGVPGKGRLVGALGEAASEAVEEGGGRIAGNVGVAEVDPNQSLLQGVGTAAGLGVIGGGTMGAALGSHGEAAKPEAAPGTPARIDELKAAQEQKEAEEAAATAETPPVEGAPPTESAAPVKEPKVRKVGEAAPLPDVLDTSTIAKIGFSRGSVHDTLVGKSSADPEVREILQKYMDVRRENGSLNPKTEAKITAFLARLPEQPAPSAETTTEEGAGGTQPTQVSTTPPTEAPSADTTQPAAGGAGAPVVSQPSAGAAPGGPGVIEPSGVVPPVADVEQPAGGEGAAPTAVTEPKVETPAPPAEAVTAEAPKAYVAPVSQGAAARAKRGISKEAPVLDSEAQIDDALAAGLIDEEAANAARAELTESEAPTTAMGQAFQKQIDDIKAQMNALRQKSGKKPALKSKARAKFDELEAQLEALVPQAIGNLADRIEALGLSSVIGKRGDHPVLDIPLLQENLLRAKASPRMFEAILNYIGVDKDGHYLPTVYSREEAAEMVGLSRATGSEVSRAAEAMGIDLETRSRFHAGQTDLGIGAAKNVSEEGTGATDLSPRRGALYEPAKRKGPPKTAPFLRGALAPDGTLDFSGVPLESTKAKGGKSAVVGLAEMFVRASQFNRKNYQNDNVINALQAEVDKRIKLDRKKTNEAITRAYGRFTESEEVSDNQKALEITIKEGIDKGDLTPVGELEGLEASELAALINEGEAKIDTKTGAISRTTKEKEVEDTGPRLSDEDYQQTRTGPVDLENSKQMDDALRGKSFMEALDYAIENSRDEADRHVLVKVKRRAEELAAKGVEFSFGLTPQGRVLIDALGVATTSPAKLGEATAVKVTLNGFTGDPKDTLSQETLAHEMVHAVTAAQITYAPQSTAAIKLHALQQDLVRIYNQRYKAGTLTATEKGVVTSALANSKELLAYGLTNGETQNWLASITDPSGGTFLSRLFDIVSQVLGLKGKETSALARLMTISEEILDESLDPYVAEANRQGMSLGKQANTTGYPSWTLDSAGGRKPAWHKGSVALYEVPSNRGRTIYVARKKDVGFTNVDIRNYTGSVFTPAELAELRQAADGFAPQTAARISAQTSQATQGVNIVGEKKEKTLAEILKANSALKTRVQVSNSLAAVENELMKAYGGLRSAVGRLNPIVLLSRALDALRISRAVHTEGGLAKVDGLYVASELRDASGRSVSYKSVIDQIKQGAEAAGETFKEYREKIDRVLYGHREYHLRELVRQGKLKPSDIDFGLKDPQIDEMEAAYNREPDIQQISKDLDTIRFHLIDKLVESGRISEQQATEWKSATGYIPFSRIVEEIEKLHGIPVTNRGVTSLKNIKKYEGSERMTLSPIESFSKFMDWAVSETVKNEAALRTLEDLTLLGIAEERPKKPQIDSPGDMVDTVYRNGERVSFYVSDPLMIPAFVSLDPALPGIVKAMRTASKILRAGVTSMPPFAFKQVMDDITRAYAYAGVKNNKAMIGSILRSLPREWFNEIRGKKSANIKQLERLGISANYDFSREANLKHVLTEAGAQKEGIGHTIMRWMEAGAKASDTVVRNAIYEQILKETGDVAKAESAAREIINFSRHGNARTISMLTTAIPFFNATAQGMDKLAVAAMGSKAGLSANVSRAMFMKRMMMLTAMGLAYALAMKDDEEYQKLPDNIRDRNWVLPFSKQLGFAPVVSVPGELAYFFKVIPERIVQYYNLHGTKDERAALDVVKELALSGVDVFSAPNLTPQMIRPIVENLTNYSWFLKRPLESQAQIRLDPHMRYGAGTSETVKGATKWLYDQFDVDVSPIKVENLLRGMLGTGAGLGISLADAILHPESTDRPLHQQLLMQATGASAIAKDTAGSRWLDSLYDLDKHTSMAKSTLTKLMKDSPQDVGSYVAQNKGMLSIEPAVTSLMESIRAQEASIRTLDNIKAGSPGERRTLFNKIRGQEDILARQVYELRNLARQIQERP